MTLQGALSSSLVGAAKRPYYSVESSGEVSKTIISFGNLEDVYVVWTGTGEVAHDLADCEKFKVQGKNDWLPV